MDLMSLKDSLIVGIPEAVLSLLFALYLVRSKLLKDNKIKSLLLLIISSIIIQTIVYFNRANFSNLIVVSFISLLGYSLVLKVIYRFKLWTAFLSGSLIILLLLFFDIFLITPFSLYLSSTGSKFYGFRFILILPARIAHIIIIYIMYKLQITMHGTILEKPWNELSSSTRSTIVEWLSFLGLSILFITNYIELFKNTMIYDVLNIFGYNGKIFYLATVLILVFAFSICKKLRSYIHIQDENNEMKFALNRDPVELLFIFLNIVSKSSSPTQRKNLQNEITKFLNFSEEGGEMDEEA